MEIAVGLVLSRKGGQEQSPGCPFGSWDDGEGDTLSLTPSAGTPVPLVLRL